MISRWWSKLSKVVGQKQDSRRSRSHKRRQTRPICLESLEARLVPSTLYVDNPGDFFITNDQGAPGLDNGDTVTWNPGAGSAHGAHVPNLTFGTDAFGTINSAIAAALNGDIIRVAGGTFNEDVNVTKDVTLLGNNAGRNPNTTTRGPESIVLSGVISGNAFITNASGVTVDGFT